MPKPIGSPRNLTAVQDQLETVLFAHEVGIALTFHRRQVSRDNTNALVGSPGQLVSIAKQVADLPPNVQNALTIIANYGDSL